ncbi:unnamed protein product [Camellia sinensis]
MKLSKQKEEQTKKAKTQMEVKDVEIVLLNEGIAMLAESNLYLDSQEEQIAVEVEATTPKISPLVSSMIKRVKNRETRKEHKDPDFWYITKRQPKQNKTVDEVEPMVEESAKTRKEENPTLIHPDKFQRQTENVINSPQQEDTSADMLTIFLTDQQVAQRQIPDENIDDLPLQ